MGLRDQGLGTKTARMGPEQNQNAGTDSLCTLACPAKGARHVPTAVYVPEQSRPIGTC